MNPAENTIEELKSMAQEAYEQGHEDEARRLLNLAGRDWGIAA